MNNMMKRGRRQKRKPSTKQRWIKRHGKIPRGHELDHKIPLSEGGTDTLWNLRLIKKKTHEKKTAREARKRFKRRKK